MTATATRACAAAATRRTSTASARSPTSSRRSSAAAARSATCSAAAAAAGGGASRAATSPSRPRSTSPQAATGAHGRGLATRPSSAVRALPRQRRRAGHADRDLPALPGHRPAARRHADAVRPGGARGRVRRLRRRRPRRAQTPCKVCRGRGRKVERPKLTVDVPAGIADGQRIRITGRGHAGERGGPPGDLYVLDPRARGPALRARRRRPRDRRRRRRRRWRRSGRRSRCRRSTARSSSRSRPARSRTRRFTSAARGCRRCAAGAHGDLRVVVNVVIPRHLSREQRELLEQLADSLTDHNLRTDEGVFGKLKRAFGGLTSELSRAPARGPRPREHAELVLAELLELAPERRRGGRRRRRRRRVRGLRGARRAAGAARPEAAAGDALVEVSTTEIADDWSERWREFHRPLVLDDRLTRAAAVGARRPALRSTS